LVKCGRGGWAVTEDRHDTALQSVTLKPGGKEAGITIQPHMTGAENEKRVEANQRSSNQYYSALKDNKGCARIGRRKQAEFDEWNLSAAPTKKQEDTSSPLDDYMHDAAQQQKNGGKRRELRYFPVRGPWGLARSWAAGLNGQALHRRTILGKKKKIISSGNQCRGSIL